tara:strand:- start:2495 stop:3478 length:984 start_codon:yes stop_codon:yes gene_type:complete
MLMKYPYLILPSFTLLIFISLWSPLIASDQMPFDNWLEQLKTDAIREGVTEDTINTAFANIELLDRVIELDRSQPESTITLEEYLNRVVTQGRIQEGTKKLSENKVLLDKVTNHYGVPARFIVALWGIETNFGAYTGGFSVINALSTLAYDGRRSEYFRKELLTALKIIDDGHITAMKMLGSWAGAMGQSQFMPSSFQKYAVDFDNDGRTDIWQTKADVFASASNYLVGSGWVNGETWGRKVRITKPIDSSLISMDVIKSLKEWHELGIRRVSGEKLPIFNMSGSLIRPGSDPDNVFLVYQNYRAILRWNRSHYFGLAVGHLADSIR